METLPKKFSYLTAEPSPKILLEALKLFGVYEYTGVADNPEILSWAKELGLQRMYSADSIPWCGLFMAICAKRAGVMIPENPLWAINWVNYGTPITDPMFGDVLVFKRPGGGGHVALYVGEDKTSYYCLGGNQSDKVCITKIAKSRLFKVRRTAWKVTQPTNIRKIMIDGAGIAESSKED